MPEKKYLIEIPDMPEGTGIWDAEKWERNKDAFMADNPTAKVFELGEYDAEDKKDTDQFLLTFDGDEDSSGIWDADKWERNREAFLQDYPEATVNRVRYVDYWGQQAEANRAKKAELQQLDAERNARLAELGYYDDVTKGQADFSLNATNVNNLKPLSSAIEVNSVSGDTKFLDPNVQEFFAKDTADTERMAEIARLDAEYDANPSVVAYREWLAQMQKEQEKYRGNLRGEINTFLKEDVDSGKAGMGAAGKRVSPKYGMTPYVPTSEETAENEKREKAYTALKLLDKADIASANQGDKGFWAGAGDVAKEALLDTATQDDIEAYNEIGDILSKLESELGDLKAETITPEVLEKHLSPEDKMLIMSFFEYNKAMAEAQKDMSRAYKGGKIFAESVPFMIEFLATGGFYAAGESATQGVANAAKRQIANAFVKWVTKNSAKKATRLAVARGVQKATTSAISALAGTAIRTAASPGTYERMAEASVEIDKDGHLHRAKNAFKGGIDMYIENLSEMSGGAIGKAFGWLGKGAGKLATSLGGATFAKVGSFLGNNKTAQMLLGGWDKVAPKFAALGFHGIFEEVGEEILGNALREVTFVQPGALKEMFEDDNFGAMLLGFAPMTIFGAGVSAVSIGATNIQAAKLGEEMRNMMSSHYSADQIDYMLSGIQSAENADQMQEAINPMLDAISMAVATGQITQEEAKDEVDTIYRYGMFMAQNKALLFAQREQDRDIAEAKRTQMTDRYGRFWQDGDNVQIAELNDGRTVFVTSEAEEDGTVAIVDAVTGQKGFANISDIATEEVDGEMESKTNTMTMDAFLYDQIAMERKNAEQVRMTNERNAQIDALRGEIVPGTQLNLGTEGSPIIVYAKGSNRNGVSVIDQFGVEHVLGWEQAADALKKPIVVLTDRQILDAKIAERAAEMASRRRKYGSMSPTSETASEEAVNQAETTAAEEQRHIPMNEDGTVNERAFWEQDPEGYVAWNDEQNQDGGADSLEQISITKAETEQLLSAAIAATRTSDPVARKQASKEAARLMEKIALLETLEQRYDAKFQEEVAALEQTNATPTASMNEEDLTNMDAQYQSILSQTRLQRERVRVMQEYLDKLAEGSMPIKVLTAENYEEVMKAANCPDVDIARVGKAIKRAAKRGSKIAGFASAGTTFIMADTISNIEEARITYVHERQHLLNSQNPEAVKMLADTLADKENALRILEAFVGKNGLEEYKNDTLLKLADEILCRSMELVYSTENYSVDLQEKGLSEEAINIINTINDEQRTDKSLASARRSSHANGLGRENAEENGRNSEQVSRGILGGEEVGSLGSSGRGDRAGEGAEVGTSNNEGPSSRITSKMDEEYLRAVEAGDMETAQRMVIEAARLAMPNTKVVDENGNPLVVYHGTNAAFTEFQERHIGSLDPGYFGRGFYFTPDRSVAEGYAKGANGNTIMSVFLDISNPVETDMNNTSLFGDRLEGHDGVIVRLGEGGIVIDNAEYNPNEIAEIVAKNANQIKSADPVTYDDNGNVIPLSERFNKESNDIRFRATADTRDANGVTAEQNYEINRSVGGELETGEENDAPVRFSISAIGHGAGLELLKNDGEGNVALVLPDGRKFNAHNLLKPEDIKSLPDTVLSYMMKDARVLGNIDARKEWMLWNKYTLMLNAILSKGSAENGGFEYLASQWQWIADTVYKTVATNSDTQYSFSLDITRVCKKNEAVINAIAEMQARLGYGITPGQIMDIYMSTIEEGYQVPCPVCYVFSRYIRNGKYATIMINGQRKYGSKLVDPRTLSDKEKDKLVKYWLKELKKIEDQNEKNENEINKANSDITVLLDEIDKLSKQITDPRSELTEEQKAQTLEKIHELDARYKAALNVVSQSSLDSWITQFAIYKKKEGGKEKWVLYEDSYMGFPEEMALDLRQTSTVMRLYPAIQRFRKSRGAAAGKEITFVSNNDLGDVALALGSKGATEGLATPRDMSEKEWAELQAKENGALMAGQKNLYQQAVEETDPKKKADLLKKASERFASASEYAKRQSLRGGQRMWSWSDNIERLAPDVFVNLFQMEMLGGALQSYSKQLEGIKLVASMNGYVNGSLMGKGNGYAEVSEENIEEVDGRLYLKGGDFVMTQKDGKTTTLRTPVYKHTDGKFYVLEFDDVVGIDAFGKDIDGKHYKGLFELNSEYDKAGNILVGMNDLHIRIAMADDRIFFIIPWHSSGANSHILAQMYDYLGVEYDVTLSQDYTDVQSEKRIKGVGEKEEDSKKAKKGKEKKESTPVSTFLAEFWNDRYENAREHNGYGMVAGKDFACGIEGGIASSDGKGNLSEGQMHYRELRDAIFMGVKVQTGTDKKGKPTYKNVNVEEYSEEWFNEIMNDEFLSQVYSRVREYMGEEGRMASQDTKSIYPYEYWDEASTYATSSINGARYIEYCRRLGYKPKFCGKLDGKPETDFGNFTEDAGYWKTLIDRRMYAVDGKFQGLTPVTAENFTPDLVDPEATKEEFVVTRVADEKGTQTIVDRAIAKENNRPGGIAKVDYDMTLDKALKAYNNGDVRMRVSSSIDLVEEAKKAQAKHDAKAKGVSFRVRTDEQREKLFEDAKKEFGTTKNFNEAGYMLPDASLLDFSEKDFPGERSIDHRAIEGVIIENGNRYENRWEYLADFMNEGAIRLLPESAGINMIQAPTEEQRKKIFDFIYKYNGEVILEINDERLNSIVYMEYDRRTSPSRIFRDIDGYFNEGIVPQQDVRFRVAFDSANSELNNEGISINNPALMEEYGLSDITLSKKGNYVTLSKVVVADKGNGNGTRFMSDLTKIADENGWTLVLTPDKSFGASSVARLKKFYKRFGFKDNKGRNTDFNTKESMVRTPSVDVRFRMSNENQAIFVSNAAKAVEGIKMEKATPEQWLKMIEKNGGLKAGEDKWMGLSDWLKASDKKTLTKAEVLDFINENMIVIEEQHYEEDASDEEALWYKYEESEEGIEEINYQMQLDAENHAELALAGRDLTDEEWEEEYDRLLSDYMEDDLFGSNYSAAKDAVRERWMEEEAPKIMEGRPREINTTRLDYTTAGLANLHEIALTVPTIESWNESDDIHFGDAGEGRAVAWIRFGDTQKLLGTVEVEGKKKFNWAKVLVIDEIQSKRHQEGRDQGYSMSREEYQKKLDALEIEGGERLRRRTELLRALKEKYGEDFRSYLKLENTAYVPNESVMSPEEVQEWNATSQEEINDAIDALKKQKRAGVPDAPFDKNWHELAMKRMLRYAAENGYDVIAWTTGDQQAERYGLGGKVESISSTSTTYGGNPAKEIFIDFKNQEFTIYVDTNGNVVDHGEYEGRNLGEIVGKELAVKLLAEDTTLSGDGLRIGGEGMKGFYDKMLPAFMNKYGKKWGVKVEDINFPGLEGGLTMHSVPVTEEMKSSVMEGQVMFRINREDYDSAVSFTEAVVQKFSEKYFNTTPISILDGTKPEEALRALGLESMFTPKDIENVLAGYIEGKNIIAIFAKDRVREVEIDEDVIENAIFHECIHQMTTGKKTYDRLSKYLWDNADALGLSEQKADIEAEYEESQWYYEMIASALADKMTAGKSEELLRSLPAVERAMTKVIFNKFGYEPGKEDIRRANAVKGISRGNLRNEEGLAEIQGGSSSETRFRATEITPEEKRKINEFFPGAFKVADSKGNTLTPGQERFFANSKAVDKDGNLLVLYHGTPRAGFTEFTSGWFTTSKEDAISYSGDRKGRLFDPNEKYEPETLVAGDYRLGYMTFDSEEDRAAFLAEYPDAESAMSESEFDSMTLQADEEYDDLIARKPELQKIWNAYREYERERFVDTAIGDIMENAVAYTEDDLRRAMLAYDSNANFDSLDDMDAEERRAALVTALRNADEETEGGIADIKVATRVPRNGEGQKHNDLGNRTYEVYANVENPYEIDANGRGSEFESGDIYKAVEGALTDEQYDGVIIRNWRVGRYQQLGDVVVPKSGSQIKLTSNENPSEGSDIRFRTSLELDEEFGDAWRNQQNEDGRHSTQVANTKSTYEKIGRYLEDAGMKGASILDASSGLGLGTQALREMGFQVDDVEPFPSENREAPTFSSYADIDGKYDVVISNAVLNVIPDDWRADVLHQMADAVKDGGKMIINTRPASNIAQQGVEGKTRITLDSPSEILVKRGDRIAAYQKGFTSEELAEWIKSELGEGWRVEKATKKNSGISGEGTAVVIKEYDDTRFRTIGTPTEDVVADGVSLSPSQTASLAGDIFAALPEESRKKITDGLNGNILGLQDAIMQIPTSLAMKEDWNEEDTAVAEAIAREMDKFTDPNKSRPLSTYEALWMLYDAMVPASSLDLVDQASRVIVKRNLGLDEASLERREGYEDDIRFRTVGDASINAQASLYNKGVVDAMSRLKESFVDMNTSVEKLVRAIERKTGKKAEGFEDILKAMNQQASKGDAAMKSYLGKFLEPMFKAVRDIMDAGHYKYEDVVRYVILKHGLERNDVFAKRDAKEYYRAGFDKKVAAIMANNSLSDAEKQAKIDEAQADLDFHNASIDSGSDAKYHELRENDYSGLSSMFYDQLDVDRKNYDTEEEYQSALMAAKADKYSSLADIENAAKTEVENFENAVNTDNLWAKINAATKETLKQQYEANMISKDQYEGLRDMFQFYVPLRGFKDNTAEDMYTYYSKPNKSGYTKPILAAEGRKTEAESPFGWIASMAGSAIASDVKNEAKLALYYFISNRPDNGIATISKTWFVDSGEVDADGKAIFKPVYPPFSEDLSSDAAKANYEAWQENMRKLRDKGMAYESGQRLNLGNAVVHISDVNKPEHIVTVKVAGKDYTIIVNGNPRAAQAINGMLNIEATAQDYSALFGPLLRWMSSVNTSYNPEFWITNFMRDTLFTFMSVSVKEDPTYRRKFYKNYAKAFKVIKMTRQNYKGTLGDSYLEEMYKDFNKYGGITGATQIKGNEEWEKEIAKYLASEDPNSIKKGWLMRNTKELFTLFHQFGESLEQVSRFAAFLTAREMGKPMAEAIDDAKEITVNFNRKGSGKRITLEEAKYLTNKNGQPLNDFQKWMVVGLSSIAPLGRRTIMFFNAAIQGLNATAKLIKKNPKKFAAWSLAYFAFGVMNAVLHNMFDDDDDYLDMPEYERRNALMLGGNGVYFKWALPQEMRVFYGLGDLAVEEILGRNPHESALGEAVKIISEIAPINPTEGWRALLPSVAIPFVELGVNEDYKGDPIYNEQKWLTEEEKERTAKWANAYKSTGRVYIEIAKALNGVSGGNDYDAGLINLQPEKIEHLVQSAFGGTVRTADKAFSSLMNAFDPDEDVTIRQFPFVNRVLTLNDERYKNVHVNDVFDWYEAEALHALALEKKYRKNKMNDELEQLRASDEYKWAEIYRGYKTDLKLIKAQIKAAEKTNDRMHLMKIQDQIKKSFIKEISDLKNEGSNQ